jgi:hypothetical protein
MSHESARPVNATAMLGAQELHGEILDPSTGNVWQSLEPITREDYQGLPLEPGWLRVGVGRGAMDEHWFARSPGRGEDGPMELLEIGGRRFGLCARPASRPSLPAGPDGPRMLLVDKHHVVRFRSGRQVPILMGAEGNRFVHVIEGGEGKAPLALPDSWRLECVSLIDDWVLQLPNPTTVFFFANGDSYQGPLATPSR